MCLTPDGVPSCLIRAFTEERHLQNFVAGDILIRRLDAFRSIEDLARRDRAEGEVRLVVPGEAGVDVHGGGSFHSPVYLLCCSDPRVDKMTTSFGTWWATISNPGGFLSALSLAAADAAPGRDVMDTLLLRAPYTKANKSPVTPGSEERYRLMLAQRSPRTSRPSANGATLWCSPARCRIRRQSCCCEWKTWSGTPVQAF